MENYTIFAAEKLNIDPDVTRAFLFVYGVLFVVLIGFIIRHLAPLIYQWYMEKRANDKHLDNAIWFDEHDSELHIGRNKMRIEPKSFEYFVCTITFNAPSKYHDDLKVFNKADHAKGARETSRGVEQAVRRLNKKVQSLGLKSELFARSKERTAISTEYRNRIGR